MAIWSFFRFTNDILSRFEKKSYIDNYRIQTFSQFKQVHKFLKIYFVVSVVHLSLRLFHQRWRKHCVSEATSSWNRFLRDFGFFFLWTFTSLILLFVIICIIFGPRYPALWVLGLICSHLHGWHVLGVVGVSSRRDAGVKPQDAPASSKTAVDTDDVSSAVWSYRSNFPLYNPASYFVGNLAAGITLVHTLS